MVQTINPAGSGGQARYLRDVVVFFLGASLGGVVSVMVIWELGSMARRLPGGAIPRLIALALVVLGVLREGGAHLPVPYRSIQVPERWRQVRPMSMAAFAYGAVLGLGFATVFVSSAHLSMMAGVTMADGLQTPVFGALGLAFGKAGTLLAVVGTDSHAAVLTVQRPVERTRSRRVLARKTAGIAASVMVAVSLILRQAR